MEIEYTEARINLPKEGPEIYKRICKAGKNCTYHCEHKKPHIISIACNIRCCNVLGKDVRCISIL